LQAKRTVPSDNRCLDCFALARNDQQRNHAGFRKIHPLYRVFRLEKDHALWQRDRLKVQIQQRTHVRRQRRQQLIARGGTKCPAEFLVLSRHTASPAMGRVPWLSMTTFGSWVVFPTLNQIRPHKVSSPSKPIK